MTTKQILTDEQLDFLTEMMNIGGGNAAAAIEQLFQCNVDVKVPKVYVLPVNEVVSVIGEPDSPYAGVRMEMLGDVNGNLFLLMPMEHKRNFIKRIEESVPFKIKPGELDISVLEEVGNIIAGVYLLSIHDFCKLNICHTVPVMTVDMVQAILDEIIATAGMENPIIIVVENEFTIGKKNIRAFFLMVLIPSGKNVKTLLNAIKGASAIMREEG